MPDPGIWNRDLIGSAERMLIRANELWTAQAFTGPTNERKREILDLLAEAEETIAGIRIRLA